MDALSRLSGCLGGKRSLVGRACHWLAGGGRVKWRPSSFMGRWLDASALVFLLVFSVQIVLNLIEPFGLDRAAKAQSMRISARATSAFYDSKAQDDIAVVLIDDTSLRMMDLSWPPRYSDYEQLLRRVLAHRPRAVFLDVLLLEGRTYDASLEQAKKGMDALVRQSRQTEAAGGKPVPVFFAIAAPGQASIFSLPGGIRDAIVAWESVGDAYPLVLDCHSVHKNALPLDCSSMQMPRGEAETAAWKLYQVACPGDGSDAPGCYEPAARFSEEDTHQPISVQWGWLLPRESADDDEKKVESQASTEGPDGQEVKQPLPCHAPYLRKRDQPAPSLRERMQTGWTRLHTAVRLVWTSFLAGRDPALEDHTREQCVYPFTLFAEQLADTRLLRQDDRTAGVLEDRIVLIGTHLVGLDDKVLTPINQNVPGVYMHAMALDNLMTWGSRRIRERGDVGLVIMLASSLLMSLLAGGLLSCRNHGPCWNRLLEKLRLSRWGQCRGLDWMLIVVGFFCLLAVGLGMTVIAQKFLRLPPQDWLGPFAAAMAALLFIRDKLPAPSGRNEGGSS